ncbi:S1C family serine protease [Nocardioides jishulii]|uniref:PDZ domain-containing protein n=1 Tax=Nocardioides jishulii TaxID=2575440 RepID=A0A4U2YJD6_9ACTN|nr:trypsin-like peptidase domain-containing protein [Nocardioides jishulii]QCX26782.1 PDZ domain-containing protein [Nocardioides jishulii]TKI61266.1 PDZ domain-containing protein [Nocardioides jishulii]
MSHDPTASNEPTSPSYEQQPAADPRPDGGSEESPATTPDQAPAPMPEQADATTYEPVAATTPESPSSGDEPTLPLPPYVAPATSPFAPEQGVVGAPGPAQGPFGPPTGFPPAAPVGGRARRPAVPGWTWPAMAATALVLGLLGGVLGAGIQERIDTSNLGLGATSTRTAPPLGEDNDSIAAVANELLPSTVQVLATGTAAAGTGSGFVLDSAGHVVTNNHVVAGATGNGTVEVVDSSGSVYDAEVIGRSSVYDLAVLKVEGAKGLRPASLGSSDDLLVGDEVVAFGAPLGLSQTVTAGIVSAKNRPVTTGASNDESSFINAVQTDAAINPGNSGGPLVDLQGRVVGVNTAIATTGGVVAEAGNIGVGFAIPIEQVKVTADQILRTGKARYPVIGARVDTSKNNKLVGAVIDEVLANSPAQSAGLEDRDLVLAVDGVRVTDGISLIVRIRTFQPGDEVEFTVRRDDQERTLTITLGSEVG